MIQSARKNGEEVEMLIHSVEEANRRMRAGVKIIVYASDVNILKNGYISVIEQLREKG